MMVNKLCIWIIGSNSVGKTTQARLLHEYFAELYGVQPNPQLIKIQDKGLEVKLTTFSPFSVNLGDLTTSQCGGTDTLGTKNQIISAYNLALQISPVVIVEGIMATGQWIDFLKQDKVHVILIYLRMSDDLNFERLRNRRAIKKGISVEEVILTEKTKDNVIGKLRGFESLYERMKNQCDYFMKVNVDQRLVFDVFDRIKIKLEKIILNL